MAAHEDPRWLALFPTRNQLAPDQPTEPRDANCTGMPADLLELWEEVDQLGGPIGEHVSLGPDVVTRSEWGARDPRSASGMGDVAGPACHYEGPHLGWPFDHARCFTLIRGFQAYHMDHQGWSDIAYNWLVCGHGSVFEGRGHRVRPAAQGTSDGNSRYEAICWIGGDGDEFTTEAQEGFWAAADLSGLSDGDWRPHSSFVSTSCPGAVHDWLADGHPRPGGTEPFDYALYAAACCG